MTASQGDLRRAIEKLEEDPSVLFPESGKSTQMQDEAERLKDGVTLDAPKLVIVPG